MAKGKVKWFNMEKGFGFIVPEDGGKDVFVHRNNVEGLGWNDGLEDGEEVEFEVERTPKGLAAMNVQRMNWAHMISLFSTRPGQYDGLFLLSRFTILKRKRASIFLRNNNNISHALLGKNPQITRLPDYNRFAAASN